MLIDKSSLASTLRMLAEAPQDADIVIVHNTVTSTRPRMSIRDERPIVLVGSFWLRTQMSNELFEIERVWK